MWAKNAGHKEGGAVADVLLSKIVVPVANAEEGRRLGTMAFVALAAQRTHAWRVEGGGTLRL